MQPRLTQAQVNVIQGGDQENQIYQVGQRIKDNEDQLDTINARVVVEETYGLIAVKLSITADATSGINFTMPTFAFEIMDVVVHATATSGSGTATLRRSTTAMTDAIICAVADAVTRAGSIIQAQKNITSAEVLNIVTNGANDRGEIIIFGRRT